MNQYNQVPHLTQDTVWESDKNTRKHHKQESQEVSPFPTGDHKAARNSHDSMAKTNTNNKKDQQKSFPLKRSVRKLLEGLNKLHVTNLTISSDVDQDIKKIGLNHFHNKQRFVKV